MYGIEPGPLRQEAGTNCLNHDLALNFFNFNVVKVIFGYCIL